MRNLKEYPITKAEIIEYLESYAKRIMTEGRIGDMRPTYLKEAAEHVRRSTAQLSDIGTVQDSTGV
jgi:hypothetical protein